MRIKKHPEQQKLLILSKDIIEYKKIIEEAGLPYLSILAVDNPRDAIMLGNECNLLFGEPSLVSQVINNLPNLQWCQITWAGVEPLLASGLRRDYTLTNARNVYGSMMSEYVFGYLLFIERRILTRWQSQLNRNWDESPNGTLKDKAIGLLGVGTIGSHLATTAHHFGMRVHGYSRNSENCQDVDQYFHGDAILDFVSNLDYLVSSLPATPATMQMINNDIFSALPNKAWLVNIGRGSTVDETALVNALNSRMISGAILDVFEKEPLPEDHPLWQTPNTFVTSHTGARNYIPDIARLFIENYKLYINGKSLQYQVSFEKSY
jgi:phosphoglycerate dehydrogenase-like enzyme